MTLKFKKKIFGICLLTMQKDYISSQVKESYSEIRHPVNQRYNWIIYHSSWESCINTNCHLLSNKILHLSIRAVDHLQCWNAFPVTFSLGNPKRGTGPWASPNFFSIYIFYLSFQDFSKNLYKIFLTYFSAFRATAEGVILKVFPNLVGIIRHEDSLSTFWPFNFQWRVYPT